MKEGPMSRIITPRVMTSDGSQTQKIIMGFNGALTRYELLGSQGQFELWCCVVGTY